MIARLDHIVEESRIGRQTREFTCFSCNEKKVSMISGTRMQNLSIFSQIKLIGQKANTVHLQRPVYSSLCLGVNALGVSFASEGEQAGGFCFRNRGSP